MATRGAWSSWQRLDALYYDECCQYFVGDEQSSLWSVGSFEAQVYFRYAVAYRRVGVECWVFVCAYGLCLCCYDTSGVHVWGCMCVWVVVRLGCVPMFPGRFV